MINETDENFRRDGEGVATWLAISFLMAREAHRDPTFLTEICSMFDREFAELGLTQNHEQLDRLRLMARRRFQLMVTAAEILAKEGDQAAVQPSPSEEPPDLAAERSFRN